MVKKDVDDLGLQNDDQVVLALVSIDIIDCVYVLETVSNIGRLDFGNFCSICDR